MFTLLLYIIGCPICGTFTCEMKNFCPVGLKMKSRERDMKNGLPHLSAAVRLARDKSGEQSDQPIYHAVERARRRTVQDHRSGDRENFRSNAEDKALCLWSSRTH